MHCNFDVTERYNYIYIIYLSTIGQSGELIFKFGKTHDIFHRFFGYPKNSVLLYCCRVIDCHWVESEIYIFFKQNFEQMVNLGREYFRGDIKNIIGSIDRLIDHMGQRMYQNECITNQINETYKNHLTFKMYTDENKLEQLHDELLSYCACDLNNYVVKKRIRGPNKIKKKKQCEHLR